MQEKEQQVTRPTYSDSVAKFFSTAPKVTATLTYKIILRDLPYAPSNLLVTRKRCYRKGDRAMRPIAYRVL